MEQLTIFDFIDAETTNAVTVSVAVTNKVETKKEETVSTSKLSDFGEKIGMARKDLWAGHITYEVIKQMSDSEKKEYITKNNIFPKPNWKKLLKEDNSNKLLLFAEKQIRDALPVAPAYDYYPKVNESVAEQHFVELVQGIKEMLDKVVVYDDLKELKEFLYTEEFVKGRLIQSKGIGLKIDKVYRAIQYAQPENKAWLERKMRRTNFCEDKKKANVAPSASRKKKMPVEELKSLNESGFNYIDRDVTPDDILSLGFRGGEFGNWTNQVERQKHLNYTYNSINNMALALGVMPKQLLHPKASESYNALGIGFGSRGHSSALAHYEPTYHVINLTRMKGAGSLGHELGHAFDHLVNIAFGNGSTTYSFENSCDNSMFNNIKVADASLELYKAIHQKKLTVEETAALYKEKCEKILKSIREILESVELSNAFSDKQKDEADEIIRDYLHEVSLSDDYNLSKDDELTKQVIRDLAKVHYLFDILNELKYRRFLSECRNAYSKTYRKLKEVATSGTREVVQTKFYTDACALDTIYSKQGHGYWNSDVELFARAWACYIKDKLANKGIVDDYLCGHADTAGLNQKGEIIYTSPKGKEREEINQAFDKYIQALKDENFF